ncbi:capsular biosynthesis protein [Alcaligenaceae bacterium]|nr:capsular biosynthesis protein [Alcaligenaceae bacterium]
MTRSFLFLQGVCSPFFSRLGEKLKAQGQDVSKINFNGGDAAFWRAGQATPWAGSLDGLADFYQDYYQTHGITDIVLFGDQRPVHKPAIELARQKGVRTHVYEEGYFRPFWLTLERSGVNAHSLLPKDPEFYLEAGKKVPRYRNGETFGASFSARAWHDVLYHVCSLRNRWAFPEYVSHAPHSVWTEYSGYVKRAVRLGGRKRRDADAIASLVRKDRVFYLLPLQLDSDTQIRLHSCFEDMSHFMDRVMRSFAAKAAGDAWLVIKNHPLDPGLAHHERHALALAKELDIQHRIVFLESGHLPTLLSHATGVITVNSTVGGSALWHARPLIALGQPIYDMAGLTFQGQLDEFWHELQMPDMRLFHHFRNVVIHTTQINGGFYSEDSIRMAVERSVERLMAEKSPLEALSA